ncbi:hypothetical protein BU16DRAFT_497289, partial [Lophium mytilinum]
MDRASQVLAQGLPPDVPKTYAALSEHGDDKAQQQQYLTVEEEKALVTYLLLMSALGHPVRIKYIPRLAFILARQRSTTIKPTTIEPTTIKPPNKNWPQAFEKRHPELKARRVRSIDWKRHENNIYFKITH